MAIETVPPTGGENSSSATASDVQLARTSTIESIVGPVRWITDQEGFVACPGRALHTHYSGDRDCKLYLDQVPTLTCFHSSCRTVLVETNRQLRRALAGDGSPTLKEPRAQTAEEKLRLAEFKRREDLRRIFACSQERILRENAWPYAEIVADSPTGLSGDEQNHWRLLLALFQDGDVIWIGDVCNSGKPEHAAHFRRKDQWASGASAPGQYVCPAVFKEGSFSRGNANIVARRFLVVESDLLTKDQVGGVFRWLKDKVGLRLRAIVDTAGKSLHGWFDFPEPAVLDDLKIALPQLGCDAKLFTASQPVRLPGALREHRYQKLVWLEKGGAL